MLLEQQLDPQRLAKIEKLITKLEVTPLERTELTEKVRHKVELSQEITLNLVKSAHRFYKCSCSASLRRHLITAIFSLERQWTSLAYEKNLRTLNPC